MHDVRAIDQLLLPFTDNDSPRLQTGGDLHLAGPAQTQLHRRHQRLAIHDAELVLSVRADALWVPEQAIVPVGEQQFVFRVVNGKALMTPVQLGLRRPGQVEVSSGLDAGAVVVSEGQQKLIDGADVVELPHAAADD